MPVFISWSGDRSRLVAKALSGLIERTNPDVRAWMSQQSIRPGALWEDTLMRVLKASRHGVLCVTPDNLNAPWLMFEAGAIAKNMKKDRVVPYLFDVTAKDVDAPLGIFNCVDSDYDGTWALMKSLSTTVRPRLDDRTLGAAFEAAWPEFRDAVAPLRNAGTRASGREIKRLREHAEAFGNRVQGAWVERIQGDGIGFFNLRMDPGHNTVRVDDGFFYDQKGNFVAEFRSATSRIDEQHGKEAIVYLRECHREGRDQRTWFHGYGDMRFGGPRDAAYDSGEGTFYDGDVRDPKRIVEKRVKLRRLTDEEAIRIVDRGTEAERQALARAALKRRL